MILQMHFPHPFQFYSFKMFDEKNVAVFLDKQVGISLRTLLLSKLTLSVSCWYECSISPNSELSTCFYSICTLFSFGIFMY